MSAKVWALCKLKKKTHQTTINTQVRERCDVDLKSK